MLPPLLLTKGSSLPQRLLLTKGLLTARAKATSISEAVPAERKPPLTASQKFHALKAIPGPKTYPLVGALPFFIKHGGQERIFNVLEELYRNYGMVTKFQIFGINTAVLVNPDDCRNVYAVDGKYPSDNLDFLVANKLYGERRNLQDKILSGTNYENWRNLRTALQKHILPPQAAMSYLSLINPISEDFSKFLPQNLDNIHRFINRYTFEVMANVLFAQRMGAIGDKVPDERSSLFIDRAIRSFTEAVKFVYSFPLWKFVDTPALKQFFVEQDFLIEFGKEKSEELMKNLPTNPEHYGKAYLARALQANELGMEEILVNTAGFFAAGVDTTSNTLLWFFIHMAQNPEAQERLYQEISSVLQGGNFDEKKNSQLVFMKQCFRESVRKDPIANFIPRKLRQDITLHNGMKLTTGMDVWIAVNPLYNDPKYFEEPEKYNPDRWSEEAKAKRAERGNTIPDHPMMLNPFSFGPRMCIGSRLATVEMNSLVCRVFQDYKVEWVPNQPPIEKVSRTFIVPKVFPKLKFIPRT